jgi:hypothetical protein
MNETVNPHILNVSPNLRQAFSSGQLTVRRRPANPVQSQADENLHVPANVCLSKGAGDIRVNPC